MTILQLWKGIDITCNIVTIVIRSCLHITILTFLRRDNDNTFPGIVNNVICSTNKQKQTQVYIIHIIIINIALYTDSINVIISLHT